MKSKQELYLYCTNTNRWTKEWCLILKQFAERQMNKWEEETAKYNNYYPVVVKLNWNVGMELTDILENRCQERVNYRDVLWVADRICQDIGKKLTDMMRLRGDMSSMAIFRVNGLDEAVMYLGPSDAEYYHFFLDDGIIMVEGYNAYMQRRGSTW